MADMSQKHGMDMFQKGDKPNLSAMNKMQDLMKSPDAMHRRFENKRKEFNVLSEDN